MSNSLSQLLLLLRLIIIIIICNDDGEQFCGQSTTSAVKNTWGNGDINLLETFLWSQCCGDINLLPEDAPEAMTLTIKFKKYIYKEKD